jgi:hypothetical protein
MKVFPKVTNTHLYVKQNEIKQIFFIVYISHGSSCDSTCILMCQRLFAWIIMYESMHSNWSYDQTIIKLWNLAPSKLLN